MIYSAWLWATDGRFLSWSTPSVLRSVYFLTQQVPHVFSSTPKSPPHSDSSPPSEPLTLSRFFLRFRLFFSLNPSHLFLHSLPLSSFPLYNVYTVLSLPFVSRSLSRLPALRLSLSLSLAAIPHCFPKGFALKLRENIQAWNSPERVLNAHLLFHFQDETRALILKNPVCPDGSLRQRCLHPSPAFSSLSCPALCSRLLAPLNTYNNKTRSLDQPSTLVPSAWHVNQVFIR